MSENARIDSTQAQEIKHVLFIVGSLREKSFNHQMAKAVEGMIGERAVVDYLDWSRVPFLNQDLENPVLPEIQSLRAAVLATDGVWVFTPEYNHGIPGGLKNVIDWLSRPMDPADRHSPNAVKGKAATISGAAGSSAASFARAQLSMTLAMIGMELIGGDGTGITLEKEELSTDVLGLIPEETANLGKQVEVFLAAI